MYESLDMLWQFMRVAHCIVCSSEVSIERVSSCSSFNMVCSMEDVTVLILSKYYIGLGNLVRTASSRIKNCVAP